MTAKCASSTFRGITDITYPVDHPKKAGKQLTFTELRNKLKEHELARIKDLFPDEKDKHEWSNAKMGFKKFSSAEFKINKE